MNSIEIEQAVYKAVAEQFAENPSAIAPETRLVDDLGADSAAFVELLTTIETRFGVDLSNEAGALPEVLTVGQLASLVSSRMW